MSIPDYIVERATRNIASDMEKHWRDEAIAAAVKKMPVWAPFSGDLLAHAELIALAFSRGHIPETVADEDRAQYVANEIRLASWGYTDRDVIWASIGDQGQLMFGGLALRAIAERVAREKGYSLPDLHELSGVSMTESKNPTAACDLPEETVAERPIGIGE